MQSVGLRSCSPVVTEGAAARAPALAALKHADLWRAEMPVTDGIVDVWAGVRSRGWVVEVRPLRAAVGGLQACVLPSRKSQFVVWVDDRPSPAERAEVGSDERGPQAPLARFRLAHELGHTLFYRPGTPPTRRAEPRASEEAFCDLFAAALLVGPVQARTAAKAGAESVRALAERRRVPLRAVWVAAAQEALGP